MQNGEGKKTSITTLTKRQYGTGDQDNRLNEVLASVTKLYDWERVITIEPWKLGSTRQIQFESVAKLSHISSDELETMVKEASRILEMIVWEADTND